MYQINNISSEPNQSIDLVLPDGSSVATLTLNYSSNLKSWYMSLLYNDFSLNGRKVYSNPNILRQWKNTLPFGLACITTDNSDPFYVDDFSKGRCSLVLLNQAEVQNFETALSGKHDEIQ